MTTLKQLQEFKATLQKVVHNDEERDRYRGPNIQDGDSATVRLTDGTTATGTIHYCDDGTIIIQFCDDGTTTVM